MNPLPIIVTLAETMIGLLILFFGFFCTRADTETGGGLDLTSALFLQIIFWLFLVVIFRICRPGKWTYTVFAGMSALLLMICAVNWYDVPYSELGSYRRDMEIWSLTIPAFLTFIVVSIIMWRRGALIVDPNRRRSTQVTILRSLSELQETVPSKSTPKRTRRHF